MKCRSEIFFFFFHLNDGREEDQKDEDFFFSCNKNRNRKDDINYFDLKNKDMNSHHLRVDIDDDNVRSIWKRYVTISSLFLIVKIW